MENNINNDVIPENSAQNNTQNTADSVVDSIPESAEKIEADGTTSASQNINTTQEAAPSSAMAIISLVLGIFSLICCCTVVPAVSAAAIGLILGIISLKNNYGGKSMATAGIVLCSIGLAIGAVMGIFGLIGSAITGLYNMSIHY